MPDTAADPGGTTGNKNNIDPYPPEADILGMTVKEQDKLKKKKKKYGGDACCGGR